MLLPFQMNMLLETAFVAEVIYGTPIVNANATFASANSYNVCQRSGMRAKPGQLVREWTGLWVLPEYRDLRSMQDFISVKAESLTGSQRPEPTDNFIESISDPSTL